MFLCIIISVYVYMCIHIHIHIHTYTYIYTIMYTHIRLSICPLIYLYGLHRVDGIAAVLCSISCFVSSRVIVVWYRTHAIPTDLSQRSAILTLRILGLRIDRKKHKHKLKIMK